MISATLIRQVLDKFLKAELVKSARIQIRTSDGVYHDIKSMKLLENRIFGARESHRLNIMVDTIFGSNLYSGALNCLGFQKFI